MGSYFMREVPDASVDQPADVGVVVVSGAVDYEVSPALKDWLHGMIDDGRRRLIVDLSEVTFIDSTAIGVLVGTSARAESLTIVCAEDSWRVRRILEFARVESVIDIEHSLERALSAMSTAT